jgi:hypothetical protein
MTGDFLTVLHSTSEKRAAKQFTLVKNKKTGETTIRNKSFGSEKYFRVETIPLTCFSDLAAALDRLIPVVHAFLIRGVPIAGTNLNHTPRWKNPRQGQPATFEAVAHHWFCVDMDHLDAPALTDPVTDPDAAIEYLIGLLPPALHDGSCWWEFTSSQSLPKTDPAAADTLSARLAFWSEALLTDPELKRWALAHNTANGGIKVIDPCLYDAIEAHYVAAPSFVGMTDPLPRRHGIRRGLDDTVSLVIPPPHPKKPDEPGTGGYEPGQGVEHYLNQIGKPHFREPIVKAVASFVGNYGAAAAVEKLKAAIRKRIDEADPGGRSEEEIGRYKSDNHLYGIIAAIRAFQGDKPGRGFIPEPPDWLLDPPPADPEERDDPDPPDEDIGPLPAEFSDEALALQFTALHCENWRYTALWGEWLQWFLTRWGSEDTLRAFELARRICRRNSPQAAVISDKLGRDVCRASTVAGG